MTQPTDKPSTAVEAVRPAVAAPQAAATVVPPIIASAPVTPPVVPPPHVHARPEPRRPGKFRRFVRSVFSHLIFAALVTAGVFGYIYQDMILGRVATTVCGNDALGPYTPGGSKSAAASSLAKAPVSAAAAPPPPAATPAAPVAAAASVAKPDLAPATSPATPTQSPLIAAKPDTSRETASKVAETPKPTTSATVPAAGVVAAPPPAAAPSSAPPAATPSKPAATAATAPVIAPTTAPATAPSTAPAATSPPDPLTAAWRAAREAFNAGKPDAIDAYKSLLRTYPDVPDLAGELGNIYYSAGKWREASETYYEAAQRYLKSPQPGYAACLLDVLRNLRSPEAERLAPQITRPCPAARTGQTASNPPRG